LTFSLILFLLYVVYLVLRSSIEGRERRAVIGSVYAIIAFLDVPLVWLSARLLPDIHPGSIHLEPAMQVTLAFSFLPVTLLAGGLVVARFFLNRADSGIQDPAHRAPTSPLPFQNVATARGAL
jgi:heme exporter protein C